MADPFYEDADVRSNLAALGPAALVELRRILEAPIDDRIEILRALTARPASADLATLIAMADTDEVVRLRLLRAIQDLGAATLNRRARWPEAAANVSNPVGRHGGRLWLGGRSTG